MKIDLLTLSDRGDEDFASLTEDEKDLYVLNDFVTISEMEGFQHNFVTDRNLRIPRVLALLEAAGAKNARPVRAMHDWIAHDLGTWDPDSVFDFTMNDEHEDRIEDWGQAFTDGIDPMWKKVATHLKRTRGIEFA